MKNKSSGMYHSPPRVTPSSAASCPLLTSVDASGVLRLSVGPPHNISHRASIRTVNYQRVLCGHVFRRYPHADALLQAHVRRRASAVLRTWVICRFAAVSPTITHHRWENLPSPAAATSLAVFHKALESCTPPA